MEHQALQVDILYIEDDEIDIHHAQREFQKVNKLLKLTAVRNASKALDMLYGRNQEVKISPKIILLDLNMPELSGVEFLKELRADNYFLDIKVFILTGAFSTDEKLAMQDLNVRGHIIKPMEYKDALNVFWALQDS